MSLGPELARRQSNTDDVIAFFKARPLQWISAVDLEAVGGRQAWRTRVSEARKRLQQEGQGTIVNRTYRANSLERDQANVPTALYLGPVISEYMFRPKPLGPDASEYRTQQGLF